MKASELIEQVEAFISKVGDQEISLFNSESDAFIPIWGVGFEEGNCPVLAIYDINSDQQ